MSTWTIWPTLAEDIGGVYRVVLQPMRDSVWGPEWHVRVYDDSERDLRKRLANLEIFYSRSDAERRFEQHRVECAVRIARKAMRLGT